MAGNCSRASLQKAEHFVKVRCNALSKIFIFVELVDDYMETSKKSERTESKENVLVMKRSSSCPTYQEPYQQVCEQAHDRRNLTYNIEYGYDLLSLVVFTCPQRQFLRTDGISDRQKL